MKASIYFLLLALTAANVTAQTQTRLIDLRVDHFNPLDRRSFDARYFINRQDWFAGGPIFVYVAGGFEDYTHFLTTGVVFDLCHETNGMMVALEPRYFGESRPTPDVTVQNLQWLTFHQQLADLAQFIGFIKTNYYGASNSRIILFGRGHGGSLALWARQKYPNLVDGIWASSAPIDAPIEYPQFLPNTYNVFNDIGGPECGQVITDAFRFMDDAVRTGDTSYVHDRLRLCTRIPVEIEEEVALMFYVISMNVANAFVTNARPSEVEEACNIMLGVDSTGNPPENDLDAFARWYMDDFRQLGEGECINIKPYPTVYVNTSWDSVSTNTGSRQNSWLSCTQKGGYPAANNGENHAFGWRFEFELFHYLCAQIFDREIMTIDFLKESIARTNEFFGGLNPHIYRAFLTQGELDPRRHQGPSSDLNSQSPVVIMPLEPFGRDFESPDETDSAVLRETKARARELIIKWIFDSIEEDQTTTPIVPIMDN